MCSFLANFGQQIIIPNKNSTNSSRGNESNKTTADVSREEQSRPIYAKPSYACTNLLFLQVCRAVVCKEVPLLTCLGSLINSPKQIVFPLRFLFVFNWICICFVREISVGAREKSQWEEGMFRNLSGKSHFQLWGQC